MALGFYLVLIFCFFGILKLSIFYGYINFGKNRKWAPGFKIPIFDSIKFLRKFTATYSFDALFFFNEIYGPIFGWFSGFQYLVMVSEDGDLIREMLNSPDIQDRVPKGSIIRRIWADNRNIGLVFAEGEHSKEIRRYTVKNLRKFGFGVKREMEERVHEEIIDFIGKFEQKLAAEDRVVCFERIFDLALLNVVWISVAGERFDIDDSKLSDTLSHYDVLRFDKIKFVLGMFPFLDFLPPLRKKLREMEGNCSTLFNFMRSLKNIRVERQKKFKEEPSDFFGIFANDVEKKKSPILTEEQLVVTLLDIIGAAMESSSTTIELTIYHLIRNPQVFKKFREEVDRVLGRERFPTLEDFPKMLYAQATILETWRKTPVFPIITRTASKDTTLNGYFIPKNTNCIANVYSLHHSKKIWTDPEVFRPERFLNEDNSKIINEENLLIFGFGKRACVGELTAKYSTFLFLSSLVQRYNFEDSPDHAPPIAGKFSAFYKLHDHYVKVTHRE